MTLCVPQDDCSCSVFRQGDPGGDRDGLSLGLRCYLGRCPKPSSSLHAAVDAGDADVLAGLLSSLPQEEPLPIDGCGNSPLHRAAALGKPHCVQVLLRHCGAGAAAQLAACNACGWAPIHACCANPSNPEAAATLRLLLLGGANVGAATEPPLPDPQFDCYVGDTCLALAAQHATSPDVLPVLHELLRLGCDPLEPGLLGTMPLEYACAAGDLEAVKALLTAASYHRRYHEYGLDPGYLLALAVAHGSDDVAELLLCPSPTIHRILTHQLDWHTAQPPPAQEPCSVLEVADGGDSGAASRERSQDGTPTGTGAAAQGWRAPYDPRRPAVHPWEVDWCLRLAIRQGSLAMVRLLVQQGEASGEQWRCPRRTLEELDERMEQLGWQGRFPLLHQVMVGGQHNLDTPLSLALRKRHLHIAKWLIKRTGAASVGRTDSFGRTPLHWAAERGSAELVELLLEAGLHTEAADEHTRVVDVPDQHGFTALALAVANGHLLAAQFLLEYGADVAFYLRRREGQVSLVELALRLRQAEARVHMLRLLMQHGARVLPKDMEAAVKQGLPADVRLLAANVRAQGGGLAPAAGTRLLLLAAQCDLPDCFEALLLEGVSPHASVHLTNGTDISLLELLLRKNLPLWTGGDKRSWSRSPSSAQRMMQALALAGADPARVLQAVQELVQEAAEEGQGQAVACLGELAAGLQLRLWLQPQHSLWPADFRAAVVALLQILRRMELAHVAPHAAGAVARAGEAVREAGGQPAAAAVQAITIGPSFVIPAELKVTMVGALAEAWNKPALAEEPPKE